jgi:hypothetical protein
MKHLLLFLSFIILLTSLSFAGDEKRKGTNGADELLIPVGARSIATGGAFIPSLKGVEAIYYNPAGLCGSEKSEAMFSYMTYIADINVSYLAVSANIEDVGAFGLSFKSLDFGDIQQTTIEDPDGITGNTYSPGYYTLGLTYSKSITDRVSAGFTGKLIHESIMNTSATGAAVDFGVQYRFQNNLSIGVAVKNIGSDMKFVGQDLQTRTEVPGSGVGTGNAVYSPETEPFQIPSFFELGLNYTYDFNTENSLMMGTVFRNNNSLQDQYMYGVEYKVMNVFALRSGYEMVDRNNESNVYGLNFGVGIEYDTENSVRVSFDYAFRSIKDFPTDNHVFTLKLGI